MIILDNEAEQHPKLAQPIPAYTIPVNRCSTSNSSLPDYDASEALHHYDASEALHQKPLKPPKRRISRLWKIVICVVFVYCFLTLAVGVPLLVVVSAIATGLAPKPLKYSTETQGTLSKICLAPSGMESSASKRRRTSRHGVSE